MLLVQNLLDGQELDESAGALVEGGTLPLGVGRITEGDEKAPLAVLAIHDGLEGPDRGAADLVGLLHLHGEPVAGEHAVLVGGLGALLSPTGRMRPSTTMSPTCTLMGM